MQIHNHNEYITCDIMDTGADEIVLGIPWLRMHNSTIDWTTGNLQFKGAPARTKSPIGFGSLARMRDMTN